MVLCDMFARSQYNLFRVSVTLALLASALIVAGCASPAKQRARADQDALERIAEQQRATFGESGEFTIERPADTLRRRLLIDQGLPHAGPESLGADALAPIPHWPEMDDQDATVADESPDEEPLNVLSLDLVTALRVGARNNNEYQERKEEIFRAALSLDTEAFEFANTYVGMLEGTFTEDRSSEDRQRGFTETLTLGASRTLRTGAELSTRIMLDLVQLLTLDGDSAYGIMADMSVSIPLLRGAGRHVVMEPLTQAERNVMYAMYTFEQYKRRYAVRVASEYLQVLQQADQVVNAAENLERVAISAERARRLAEAGRLPEIQVDQAQQEELRARDRWLSAQTGYQRRLDQLKITLGLPTDAQVELDDGDLRQLMDQLEDELAARVAALEEETPAAPVHEVELESEEAIRTALAQRPDLIIAQGQVFDAQRAVTVARDDLRWGANLTGTGRAGGRRGLGNASLGNANLNPSEGVFTARLDVDVPWSRRAARNAYRDRFIALDRSIRGVQELENSIKAEVRQALRVLRQSTETMAIQARSVELAQRRVDSTELFLQAGRAQIRDVLEAQEALVSARDALTAAVVTYRLAELELQRDMGTLTLDETGVWIE